MRRNAKHSIAFLHLRRMSDNVYSASNIFCEVIEIPQIRKSTNVAAVTALNILDQAVFEAPEALIM